MAPASIPTAATQFCVCQPGRIAWCASGGNYVREYFDNAGFDSGSASVITVSTGEAVSDIDFTLDPGGSISGQIYAGDGVTPLGSSAYLEIRDFTTTQIFGGAQVIAGGSYTSVGCLPGSIRSPSLAPATPTRPTIRRST